MPLYGRGVEARDPRAGAAGGGGRGRGAAARAAGAPRRPAARYVPAPEPPAGGAAHMISAEAAPTIFLGGGAADAHVMRCVRAVRLESNKLFKVPW